MGDSTASEQGFFTGFSGRTWLVVVINAFLGQVVSRVMKYADNITKVFAASSGVVITMVLSTYLFDFSMTLLFNLGTGEHSTHARTHHRNKHTCNTHMPTRTWHTA